MQLFKKDSGSKLMRLSQIVDAKRQPLDEKALRMLAEIETHLKVMEWDVDVHTRDPKESLPPKETERKLRLSVEWMRPFGVEVNSEGLWRKVRQIVKDQGRVFNQVILSLGTKT